MSKSVIKKKKIRKVKAWAIFEYGKFSMTLIKNPARNIGIKMQNKYGKYTWTPCEITYEL